MAESDIHDVTGRGGTEAERERLLATLERRNTQLQTAAEVSRAAGRVLDPRALIQQVVDLVRERFNLYYAGLFLVDQAGAGISAAGRWAVLRAGTGAAGQQMVEQGHKLEVGGASMIGWCVAHQQARIALDVGEEAVRFDNPLLPETRSELALPLISRGEAIGAMTIQSTQEAAFSQEDIAVLQTMADQLANAIANARLYDQAQRELAERMRVEQALRQRNRNLILLNQVGQELATTLDMQQVLERLLQAVTEIVDAEGASVWLEDEEREAGLVCWASFHQGLSRSLVNLRLRPGQGVAGWVAQTGKGIVVPRVSEDPRFFPGIDKQTDSRTESLLAVPLGVRGKVIGVLEAVNKLSGEFSMDDLVLVETLAASAAVAIDNARLIEMMRQYAAELEARNVDLDAFAHTAAHDLKGPLGYLVGFAHVLEEDHAALSDQELHHYLQILARSGRKMSNIIDELLLLASVRKVEEIELEPLDMASIVHEAQGRLAYLIAEHQAEIVLPDTWPVALGYGAWVEEVWINYLSNAIQYGGRPPLVELGATQQADGTIRFWVRDNGPGLTLQEQRRLFTPFTRLDQVRTKGHGLGLSIVRRIVEKLGGQVGVESQAGQGSTFWFTLS